MSDLIERLRIGQNAGSRVCEEAADEIERLKAELKQANAVVEALPEALKYEYPLDYKPLAEALAALETDDE